MAFPWWSSILVGMWISLWAVIKIFIRINSIKYSNSQPKHEQLSPKWSGTDCTIHKSNGTINSIVCLCIKNGHDNALIKIKILLWLQVCKNHTHWQLILNLPKTITLDRVEIITMITFRCTCFMWVYWKSYWAVVVGGPPQPPLPGRDYYNVVKVQQPNIKLYCVMQLLFPMWHNGHTFNLAQEINIDFLDCSLVVQNGTISAG